MKKVAVTLATAAACGTSIVAAPAFAAVVDLDAPGSLARLQDEQPARHEKVIAILRDAARLPPLQAEAWIRTTYHADNVSLGRVLLVSHPPKRRLTFSIDDASYAATVTVDVNAVPLLAR